MQLAYTLLTLALTFALASPRPFSCFYYFPMQYAAYDLHDLRMP